MQNIGERLRTLRLQHQLSQEQLAKEMHVTRQAISNWERGTTLPDMYTIEKIATLYEMSVDDLLQHHPKETLHTCHASVLFILSIIVFVLSMTHKLIQNIPIALGLCILTLTILLMIGSIYLTFSYAIKNNDYTMIAGYDSDLSYNTNILNKMLLAIETHICMSGFICLTTITLLSYIPNTNYGYLYIGTFFIFFLDFIFIIFYQNYQHRKDLLKDSVDKKLETILTIICITLLIMSSLLYIAGFTWFGFKNNTLPAMLSLLIFLPNIFIVIGMMIYASSSTKALSKERFNKLLIITMRINILLNILQFILFYYL